MNHTGEIQDEKFVPFVIVDVNVIELSLTQSILSSVYLAL